MALEKVKDILKMADDANTSVIAFICIDYNMVYSVIQTAKKTNTPVIVMLLPEHIEKNNVFNPKGFVEMTKELAAKVNIPVGLHLDHSYDYNSVIKAIQLGFPSVMIDGSANTLEKNIILTKKVTETAHILGVDVEGELGVLGSETGENFVTEMNEKIYTSPESAEIFCRETNVDSLTISIGNAHGIYAKPPHLDLKRLEEINSATKTPLVLHGGSGIPADQLKIAFKNGINKYNIGTEFIDKYYEAIEEYVKMFETKDDPYKLLDMPIFIQDKLKKYLENKLKLSEL